VDERDLQAIPFIIFTAFWLKGHRHSFGRCSNNLGEKDTVNVRG
jgi:hypothetical protein